MTAADFAATHGDARTWSTADIEAAQNFAAIDHLKGPAMQTTTRTRLALVGLRLGTALVTLVATGAAVVWLSGTVQASGTHRTLWLAALAVAAFLAVDRLVEVGATPLLDRLDPPADVMTVACGTPGCPVEIEVTGRMSVEDDDHLVALATDHTRHGAA